MNSGAMVGFVAALMLQVGCGEVVDADGGVSNGGGTASRGPVVVIDNDQVGGGRVTVGDGVRVDQRIDLVGFTRVSAASALGVEVKQGATFSVVVSIDSNLREHVITELRGDTLVLATQGSFETELPAPHIEVTLPRLVEASNEGSGDLSVAAVASGKLSLRSGGSGDVLFEGSAAKLIVESSGSGDTRLGGTSPALTIESSGSGDVDAEDLNATTADVDSSGSGDVSVTASGTASTRLSGSGDIEIRGGAKVQEGAQSGSGDVRQH